MTRRRRRILAGALAALTFAAASSAARAEQYRDLEASLALLPGLVDSREQGAFIDLVKAMDRVYPGKININVYPMERSIRNVLTGKADFHMPALRDSEVPVSKLEFGVADEIVGVLVTVLYSNVNKPLTARDIDAALKSSDPFPYLLEATGGDDAVKYPYRPNNQIDLSLKMLNAGRIDGFIHPQEEADALIHSLKLKNVHRALFQTNHDIIAIPKGERGSEVNRLISECIRKLRQSGELEALYSKIHRPYSDWQPKDKGW